MFHLRQKANFFDDEGRFLDNSDLSENYKQFINGWLTGETFQGVSWHNKIQDSTAFKGKALAILNEHMLSIQLRKVGIELIDYYWVKKHGSELFLNINYSIPACLDQVKIRQERL